MTERARKTLTKRLLLVGVAITSVAAANDARAQQTDPSGSATSAAQPSTDDIIVTGTRRSDRTVTTSASPIDVISAAELQSQPSANMLDTLKNLIPSFFVGQNTISDASSFIRAPSLRGLPADEVLVQLNGKRYNRAALVQVYNGGDTGLSLGSQGSDISAIPSIAIKSLQVLRDGATAQYGSDAIAGVLNYGLKDNKSGFEAEARYGQYYAGDGKSKEVAANWGAPLGDRGFMNISAEYDRDDQTSRGATRPLALILAETRPDLASKIPNYPGPAQLWGSSPTHGYKAVINTGYDVTDDSKLYLFVNLAHSYTNESFNYRSPISGSAVDANGVTQSLGANGAFSDIYLTPCPTGNATCPTGGFVRDGNVFNYSSLYPGGFTPRFIGKTDEAYGTLGYKGTIFSDLTYDLSGSLSRNSLGLSMTSSLSPSYGPATQTSFQFGKLIQYETNVNLDLSYPIEVGLASPITLSGGAEYRREEYKSTTGDLQSYGAGPYASQTLYTMTSPGVYTADGTAAQSPGASGYGGTSPEAAGHWSQKNYALYGDIESDITKALSVGIAGRYEHYNTFGGAAVGKFNAIYKFSDAFSIRGTVGSGFHAPSPGQAHDEILTTNFLLGQQVQTGTYPTNSAIAQFYGAKPLKPENSFNYGFGFVAQPMHGLTLTVDAYNIDVDKRIFITQTFTVSPADLLAEPALATVGVNGNVQYFTNGFNTRTRGVDVVATYRTHLVGGSFNATLAYNYNKSKVTKFDPSVISAAQIVDVAHLAPNHRVNLSGTWSSGPWTLNARENFYSYWRNEVDYPGQRFGSEFNTDFDVSYTFDKGFTLTAGATNILNNHPDKIAQIGQTAVFPVTGGLSDGEVYPRNGGPFGINGGFWYVRARIKI